MFCSIIGQNFLPHARVLALSLAEHHPDCRLDLLIVDALDEPAVPGEPFRRVGLSELALSLEEINRRRTLYEIEALSSSLRGPLLEGCLRRSGGTAVYLDADMLVLGSLADIGPLAERHGIVLTPHSTVPSRFKPDGFGAEQAFLQAGVFNGGFLAVSTSAAEFLRWRDERVSRDCVVAFDRYILHGQLWLSLVPALFEHHVLKDRGVNLMVHGMGDDDVTWRGKQPWIGETPIRLFHFGGGVEPHSGEFMGSRPTPPWWPRASERPGLARLYRAYGERLLSAGFDSKVESKSLLDAPMRKAYRDALIAAEANKSPEPPNPFTHGETVFTSWLAAPAWPGRYVSRYLAAVHAARADLRAAFPRVPGEDEHSLLEWVARKYKGNLPAGLPTAAAMI